MNDHYNVHVFGIVCHGVPMKNYSHPTTYFILYIRNILILYVHRYMLHMYCIYQCYLYRLYVATVNSRVRMMDDTSSDDSRDSDLDSDYDYENSEENGELSWKAGDRISVRRFLSLAETYQKEISVSDMCVIST